MDELKKIVWLSSYPKSGNTWFRAFLTALLNPADQPLDINNLHSTTIASSRLLFDEMAGVSSADLTNEEIYHLRPLIYRQNALETEGTLYHKTHDAWMLLKDNNPLFPPDLTKAVLYFIRNPLDVVVSFANHLSTSVEKTIKILNNPGYTFCLINDKLHNQLPQKLSTWSGHVKSWIDDSGLPVWVMRYEDMKNKPEETFGRAIAFIGLKATSGEIDRALKQSSFELLKQQEIDKGFFEKNANSGSFFRKGIVGDWQNILHKDQVDQITTLHKEMMERFGYL